MHDRVEISLICQLNGPHSYDKYKKPRWGAVAGLDYALFRKGPAASNLIDVSAFWWGNRAEALPDVQFFMVVGAGIEQGVDAVPGGNGCKVNLGQIRPRSRAEITLQSADPRVSPKIRPNYFSDPHDLDAVTDGGIFAVKVMDQPEMRRYIAQRQTPSPAVTRDGFRRFCQSRFCQTGGPMQLFIRRAPAGRAATRWPCSILSCGWMA